MALPYDEKLWYFIKVLYTYQTLELLKVHEVDNKGVAHYSIANCGSGENTSIASP